MPNFLGLYPMEPGTDFAQQTVGINAIDDESITEEMRMVCYDQPIYDDDCVEGDEWLGLTLGVDRASVYVYWLTSAGIRTDEGKSYTSTTTNSSRMSICGLVRLTHTNTVPTLSGTVYIVFTNPTSNGSIKEVTNQIKRLRLCPISQSTAMPYIISYLQCFHMCVTYHHYLQCRWCVHRRSSLEDFADVSTKSHMNNSLRPGMSMGDICIE